MALEFKDMAKLKWYYQVLIVAGVCGGLLGLFWYEYLQADTTADRDQEPGRFRNCKRRLPRASSGEGAGKDQERCNRICRRSWRC